MGKTYFTYILSNKSRRLYVGATSELQTRFFKHKNKWYEGSFTARYSFDMLF
jgi:predicted GIY-YIG superfamily endonuclease